MASRSPLDVPGENQRKKIVLILQLLMKCKRVRKLKHSRSRMLTWQHGRPWTIQMTVRTHCEAFRGGFAPAIAFFPMRWAEFPPFIESNRRRSFVVINGT